MVILSRVLSDMLMFEEGPIGEMHGTLPIGGGSESHAKGEIEVRGDGGRMDPKSVVCQAGMVTFFAPLRAGLS